MRCALLVTLLTAAQVQGAAAAKGKGFETKWKFADENGPLAWSKGRSPAEQKLNINSYIVRPVHYEVYGGDDGKEKVDTQTETTIDLAIEAVTALQGKELKVTWMWDDVGITKEHKEVARKNRLPGVGRWSKVLPVEEIIADLNEHKQKLIEKAARPVNLWIKDREANKVLADGKQQWDSVTEALDALDTWVSPEAAAEEMAKITEQERKDAEEAGYEVKWMWGDQGEVALLNSFMWSKFKPPAETVASLLKEKEIVTDKKNNAERVVRIKIKSAFTGQVFVDESMTNIDLAVAEIQGWETVDGANKKKEAFEKKAKAAGYNVSWMWGDADAGFGHEIARMDPVRWSDYTSPEEAITNLENANRPVEIDTRKGEGEGAEKKKIDAIDLDDAIKKLTEEKSEVDKARWRYSDPQGKNQVDLIAWSPMKTPDDILKQFEEAKVAEIARPVDIRVTQIMDGRKVADLRKKNRKEAIEEIQKWTQESVKANSRDEL